MSTARAFFVRLAPFIFLLLWSGGYATAKLGLRHAASRLLLRVERLYACLHPSDGCRDL